jgi:hypothetical protein
MADTNFTRTQGETWRVTIGLEDSKCIPQMLANESLVPLVYFAGIATKTGQTSVPIKFQFLDASSKTIGRGTGSYKQQGVYQVYAYIPADEVGSCSISDHKDRASCEAAAGTWTVDTAASLLTTTKMAVGDWKYEIRMADTSDPANTQSSKTILEGNLTIEESVVDISAGSSFTFVAPDAP